VPCSRSHAPRGGWRPGHGPRGGGMRADLSRRAGRRRGRPAPGPPLARPAPGGPGPAGVPLADRWRPAQRSRGGTRGTSRATHEGWVEGGTDPTGTAGPSGAVYRPPTGHGAASPGPGAQRFLLWAFSALSSSGLAGARGLPGCGRRHTHRDAPRPPGHGVPLRGASLSRVLSLLSSSR
jgi:hypothetical protein